MRQSGILMHITSLPGPYGIGTMGRRAYDFVDFLERSGQRYWQILPLSPTGYGDSPYQAFSACAGNHYLIDLDLLVRDGLLTADELALDWGSDPLRVDFGKLYDHRAAVLHKAFDRFLPDKAYTDFVLENQTWLPDYCLFMALKERFGGQPWQKWPIGLMMHIEESLNSYRQELHGAIEFQQFLQFLFHRQWSALRAYANGKGIRIIGDVPIYVPLDSADVWSNPGLFQLDQSRKPRSVAGCPPDSFSADGQLWGNPLYDWEQMERNGYSWWIHRLKCASGMYDVIRLDHFRGFESYWSVPAGAPNAVNGCWRKGPGMRFVEAVRRALPKLEFIAEDLGFVTDEVRQLQLDSGWPGMKVLEFAFDSREEGNYIPHLYPENSVCYTGTHDNVTLKHWFADAAPADVAEARDYFHLTEEEGFVRGMIRGAMESPSRLCIVQLQDWLELGSEARMNQPGLLSSRNWTWRAPDGFATEALAQRIAAVTRQHGRA